MKGKIKGVAIGVALVSVLCAGVLMTGCANTSKWVGTWVPQDATEQQNSNSSQSLSLGASQLIDNFLGVKFEKTVGLELKDDKTFTFAILGITVSGTWNVEGNGEYADLKVEKVDTQLLSDEVKNTILKTDDGKSIDNEVGHTFRIRLIDDGQRIVFSDDGAISSNGFLSGSDIFSMSFVQSNENIKDITDIGAEGMGNVLKFIAGDGNTDTGTGTSNANVSTLTNENTR